MTKTKSTKRALLMSGLALLLCVSMFVGSTFAWFTDSVVSGSNVITAGNLDIEVEYTLDGENWADLDGADDLFQNGLWEPGHTELVALRITNTGSLALKYVASMNIVNETAGTNKAGEEFKLSDYLTVSTMAMGPFGDDVDELTAWLTELTVSGAFDGGLDEESFDKTAKFNETNILFEGKDEGNSICHLNAGDTAYVFVQVDMPETVGNEANAKDKDSVPSIEFGINVLATQTPYEEDSFGPDYDENAGYDMPWDGVSKTDPVADENGVYHITNAAELVGLMDVTGNSIFSGKTIVLENNIDLGGKTVKGIGGNSNFAGVFDGQGFTISNFKIDATDRDYYAGLFNQVSHGGAVKNLTVKNATVIGNSMVGAVASSVDSNAVIDNCKAIDCTVIGVKKVGAVVGYCMGSTVTNNYAENCTVLYSEKEGGEVLGYENTGSTVDNNTFKNVSVNQDQVVAITSADELVALGGTDINGTYVLMADLDMTGKEMKSMVLSGGASVNFIGNGHTISNLVLGAAGNYGMTGDYEVAGLFDLSAPSVTVSLTVSDLTIKDANVECSGYAAAIVGYTSNDSVITLNNVDVDGANVKAGTVAALVGYTLKEVNLTNCDVSGLTLTGEKAEKTGAYVGTANGADCVVTVTDCTNGTTYNNYGRLINGATAN